MAEMEETALTGKCEGIYSNTQGLLGAMKVVEKTSAAGFNYLPPPQFLPNHSKPNSLNTESSWQCIPIKIEPQLESIYEKQAPGSKQQGSENTYVPVPFIKSEADFTRLSETVIKLEVDISKSIIIGSQTEEKSYYSSVCGLCGVIIPEELQVRISDKDLALLENQWHAREIPSNAIKILVRCDRCVQQLTKQSVLIPNATEMLYKHPAIVWQNQLNDKKLAYKCNMCDKRFDSADHLCTHLGTHTEVKSVQYSPVNTESQPYEHQAIVCQESKELAIKCTKCDMQFYTRDELTIHRWKHVREKTYKCTVCDKGFKQKSHLNDHARNHTGKMPYKCNVCCKAYRTQRQLTSHSYVHTAEKPYKCTVCSKGFKLKSILNVHTRIHTGEKPYKCDICDKGFSDQSNLISHRIIHISEKPYKCAVCSMAFKRKGELTRHMRIHTGEKPYTCNICGKGFWDQSTLTAHSYTLC